MAKKGKARGKQPVGRAGQRGKAQKSPSGWQQDFRFVDDTDDNEPRNNFRGFSQRGPQGSQQGTPNAKLRHQTISFIAAAPSAPVEDGGERSFVQEAIAVAAQGGESEDIEQDEDEEDIEADSLHTNILVDTEMDVPEEAMANMDIDNIAASTRFEANATKSAQTMNGSAPAFESRASDFQLFFVDTEGDPAVQPGRKANGKRPVVRAPSPAASDSSEEVVVFSGRNGGGRATVVDDPVTQLSKSSVRPSKVVDDHKRSMPAQEPVIQPSRPTDNRNMTPKAVVQPVTQPRQPPTPHSKPPRPSQAPHVTDDLLAALGDTSIYEEKPKGWAARPPRHQLEAEAASTDWTPAPSFPYWKKGGGSSKPRLDLDLRPAEKKELDAAPPRQTRVAFAEPEKVSETLPDEDEEAEKSIAVLQAEWNQVRKSKNGTGSPKGKTRRKRGSKDTGYIGLSGKQQRQVIVDDEDDDEAAYDDYMANLVAQAEAEDGEMPAFVASKSELTSGPSLVVDGKEIGEDETLKRDDEWEDSDGSESDSDAPIGQDLDSLSEGGPFNYSDIESSDLEDELEYTEKQQWEDEEDLRQRRIGSMADEQYARLLAKQLELGIDGDDLIIDDGMFDDGSPSEEGVGDVAEAQAGLRNITNSAFGRSANKHGMRRTRRGQGNDNFVDASLLADTIEQYGEAGFDIMDFDRPSLRPKKKGKKNKFPELDELSDDELKEQMLKTWETDRDKKRVKKLEREELRGQGLLGSAGKNGKADLAYKYRDGMTMKQVHEELRIFLMNDDHTTRSFPPMSKTDRKALHQVAGALNLRTKSVGSGNNRFPVVYRTAYTIEYDEVQVNKALSRSSRGFLTNASSKGKGKKSPRQEGWAKPSKGGKGGGFDKSSTGIRDGEIVGAGAKAIGADSVGHKLMEKMGWSKGMALGREGDGRLEPVEQIMRAGKAGLG